MKERLEEVRSKLMTEEKKLEYLKLKIQESNLRLGNTVDNELDGADYLEAFTNN